MKLTDKQAAGLTVLAKIIGAAVRLFEAEHGMQVSGIELMRDDRTPDVLMVGIRTMEIGTPDGETVQ